MSSVVAMDDTHLCNTILGALLLAFDCHYDTWEHNFTLINIAAVLNI